MALQNSKLYESLNPRDKRAVRRCIEATVNLKKAKKLFEDGDQAGAVDAIADAETQLGAADAVPGVSEEVKANIQGVQSALDQLKASAGIQEVDPNQGQAEAGIPPVETAAGTDMANPVPQAPAPTPIQENSKIEFFTKKLNEAKSPEAKKYYLSRLNEEVAAENGDNEAAENKTAENKDGEGKMEENTKANYYLKKMTEAKTDAAKNYYKSKYDEAVAVKSNKTVQTVLDGSLVPNDVTSKIKFKNDKDNGKPALEQTISKSEAHNGTDKGRIRWPNKKITDLESRANTNMNRVIQYTRKKPTMKESTEENPMMNSVQKLTESENRAIDRYLGKGKFKVSQLKDLGIVEA